MYRRNWRGFVTTDMMKEKLLLVGAGGFGRVVLEHAGLKYNCAFIDDGQPVGTVICGAKVIGGVTDLERLRSEYRLLVVAIGNNEIRERIYQTAVGLGYSFPNIICESAYISPFAQIGYGCVFLNNVVVQNGASVGSGVLLNPGVEIHHDSTVDDYSLIYTNSVVRTYVRVGKRVKIGSNVTVSNSIVVEDDTEIENGTMLLQKQRSRHSHEKGRKK